MATNTSWICGYGVHYVIGCLNIPRQVDSLSGKTNGTAAEILLEQKIKQDEVLTAVITLKGQLKYSITVQHHLLEGCVCVVCIYVCHSPLKIWGN